MQHIALNAATLEKLVSAAVAAPSIHNTQPWRFRLDPDTATLELRTAAERGLPLTDPAGRAMHISAGASLFNLRVAVAHFGWEPIVRLLPDRSDPGLLASVRLAGPGRRSPVAPWDLYDAVWRRHTSRLPFTDQPVPPGLLAELVDGAAEEGAVLHLPGPQEVRRVLQLTSEAERRNTVDPERREESRHWIRSPDGGPFGLPSQVLGPQDLQGRMPVRDFSALRPGDHVPVVAFEDQPVIGVLSTHDDRPADWLRAGQAMERVLLSATERGLRASMLHQALEWPDLRWAIREVHSGPSHTQMILRLGYGPEGPPTPRAAAREVLEGGRGTGGGGTGPRGLPPNVPGGSGGA